MPTLPPILMHVDVPSTCTKPAPYCAQIFGFRGAGFMLCFVIAAGFFDAAAKACSGMTAISSATTTILMVPHRLYAVA
jgi:hypothetical protein